MTSIADPLTLPCGAVLPNRLAKAAMTEGLADSLGRAGPALARLYAGWAQGGCGLLISGNVIIDEDHLERPGNVVLQGGQADPEQMAALSAWAQAATSGGAHLWAQISHAGRQTQKLVNPEPLAPSAIALGLPGGQFGQPRAMDETQVEAVIEAIARAAATLKAAGFTGVQIHAAHGYLLSSFLNPLANQRSDRFGGSLENRARPLLEAVRTTRAAVGPEFPVSVKLNSSDFQKGGLSTQDSVQVAQWLEAEGIDLLEVSGGNYEAPEMMGMSGMDDSAPRPQKAASTLAREAYFIDFARMLRTAVKTPLMLTGGFRTRAGMQAGLDEGVDVIGLGRPLAVEQDAAARLLSGAIDTLPRHEDELAARKGLLGPNSPLKLIRKINGFAMIQWHYAQFYRMGAGRPAEPGLAPLAALTEVTGKAQQLMKARSAGRRMAAC